MGALSFLFLILFSSTFLKPEASEVNCGMMQCGHGAPKIQFPFQVKGQQPRQECGRPGFELVCKDNTTLIHFPSYGNLVVKSISYDTKRLNLLDPKSCVHEVFLNLNLSLTPFRYYFVVKNYTYLNCSSKLSPSFTEVPCLSGSGNHVYTVDPSLAVPNSCRPVNTVAIPFEYSPYISGNSFGLGLSWDFPGCQDCEAKGGQSGLQPKTGHKTGCFNVADDEGFISKHLLVVLSISIFILTMAVTTMIAITIYHSKKLHCRQEEKYQIEDEKLLGDYKGLKPERCCDTDTKKVNKNYETI